MALLLDINNDLLQELMALYTSGKGGATSLQQKAVLESHGMPSEMASEEYIACARRMQANLAYLCGQADQHWTPGKKPPASPAHMTPPPHMTSLLDKYARLKTLFPGWYGLDGQPPPTPAMRSPLAPVPTAQTVQT
ncbi:hypothetical protein LTR28_011297 [Elasticomyces elasticus]|nr:hypothetical protein LTR28_011297 [Elasticomyces elasticus]